MAQSAWKEQLLMKLANLVINEVAKFWLKSAYRKYFSKLDVCITNLMIDF